MSWLSAEQRRAVVEEARTWVGTPYHHMGRLKGVGVDCAMLLCEVYERAKVGPHVEPLPYPRDWHFHRDMERYVGELLKHCEEIDPANSVLEPADLVAVKFGRTFSHGAIVVSWPVCIHAYYRETVGYVRMDNDHRFLKRPMRWFKVLAPE